MRTVLPLTTFLAALAALYHLDSIDARAHQRPVTAFVASVLYDRPLTVAAVNLSTGFLVAIATFALSTAWRPLAVATALSLAIVTASILFYPQVGARPQFLAAAVITTTLIKSIVDLSRKKRRPRQKKARV